MSSLYLSLAASSVAFAAMTSGSQSISSLIVFTATAWAPIAFRSSDSLRLLMVARISSLTGCFFLGICGPPG